MNDNTRTIVVGMMQTPPFTHMFESMRRVYSAKGLCPSCLTHGGQSRDKGIGGAVIHRNYGRNVIERLYRHAPEIKGTAWQHNSEK